SVIAPFRSHKQTPPLNNPPAPATSSLPLAHLLRQRSQQNKTSVARAGTEADARRGKARREGGWKGIHVSSVFIFGRSACSSRSARWYHALSPLLLWAGLVGGSSGSALGRRLSAAAGHRAVHCRLPLSGTPAHRGN